MLRQVFDIHSMGEGYTKLLRATISVPLPGEAQSRGWAWGHRREPVRAATAGADLREARSRHFTLPRSNGQSARAKFTISDSLLPS